MAAPNSTDTDDTAALAAANDAFRELDPHALLNAIDAAGYRTDGRINALNSYENRVYAVGLDNGEWLVSKFYRPGRWRDEEIIEEHDFCQRLVDEELPVVAPLRDAEGRSLFKQGPYRFCLFPRAGGRPPELDNDEQLEVMGRTVARLHNVASTYPFRHRAALSVERMADTAADFLLESPLLPDACVDSYAALVDALVPELYERLENEDTYRPLSLHGDMHPGNLLWAADNTPLLLDFDDCTTGPAIQDLWMFLSGDRHYAEARLAALIDGYEEFRHFDSSELALIEPLRTLRIIHYAVWIARRWDDPAFRKAFPFFAEERFWDEHLQSLQDQQLAMQEAPLIY